MVLRTRKIALIITTISILIFLALMILIFLITKTDIFKSNEKLFAKYFIQNFDIVDIINNEENLKNEKKIEESKYISELIGKIEYTEDIETSNENKNNPINKITLNINSSIDKENHYLYKDITIKEKEDNLIGFETIDYEQNYGIRLNGIKQFVSTENTEKEKFLKELNLQNIEGISSDVNIYEIFSFSNEEKENIINKYMKILKNKIKKNNYYKQSNTVITINNKDIETNSYYIKTTLEEYNNIYIDVLKQISQDEIILSKIDLLEDIIKTKYVDYNPEENLRDRFINIINEKIEEIENNNIGNEEVRITVYENDKKIVRTSIEKSVNKAYVDIIDDRTREIKIINIGNIIDEKSIRIENKDDNMLIKYQSMINNEIVNDVEFNYLYSLQNNEINKNILIKISNQKNKCVLNIENKINIVENFSEQLTLDEDNVDLDDLNEEQIQIIKKYSQNQLFDLESVIDKNNIKNILNNFGFKNAMSSIQLPEEGTVSTVERKRFNSQFEFFVSENLTYDNIKELIDATKNNLDDIKVLLKSEEIEEIDLEKLDFIKDNKDYIKNISEILLYVKNENINNEEKLEYTTKMFNYFNDSNKYNVFIQYDNNGLAKIVRIKIQDKD